MTARTTRIAAVGAGSLLALGLFTSPAFASDGAQAGASVSAGTAEAVSQTLDAVNKACSDAANVTGTATSAAGSILGTDSGISVAAQPVGNALNLSVSIPALTKTLSGLGGLPVVGSLATQAQAAPLNISCAAGADGSGLGLSAAGVDALVNAIAPGLDLSGVNLPAGLSLAADGSVTGSPTPAAPAASASGSTGSASATTRAALSSPAVRSSAAAPQPATAAANLSATPASTSSSGGLPGALARTGAGVSLLALLGAALFGSGRVVAFSRRLLRIGS